MNFLALALLLVAESETQAIYVLVGITSVFPQESAVLPTNARPIAFTSGQDAIGVDRVRNGVGEPLEIDSLGAALLVSPGALTPGETLEIVSSCGGCDERSFAWTVGAEADGAAPIFAEGGPTNVSVLGFHSGGLFSVPAGYEVGLNLPAVDELVSIRFEGDEDAFIPDVGGVPGESLGIHFFIDGGDERRECYDIIAMDVAGNETRLAEPLCLELTHELLEEPANCRAAASMSPLAVFLLSLARRPRCRPSASPRRCADE